MVINKQIRRIKIVLVFCFAFFNSMAQEEALYKNTFENVEAECDSLRKIEMCYLFAIEKAVNRKFTSLLKENSTLVKHIDDMIYMEVEIEKTGKINCLKVKTKSTEIEKMIVQFIPILPPTKTFYNPLGYKIVLQSILSFKLKEIIDENKEDHNEIDYKNLIGPRFERCKDAENEEKSEACFNANLQKHIIKNFKYPEAALRKNISGRTESAFFVEKDGLVSQIYVWGAEFILMKETKRIIELLPKLSPAILNEKEVRVSLGLPLTFRLD